MVRKLLSPVRQLPDGRWGFDDRFTTGKRIQVRRLTKSAAVQAHLELSVLVANGRRDIARVDASDMAAFRKWQAATRSSVIFQKAIADLKAEKRTEHEIGRKWFEKLSDYLARIESDFASQLLSDVSTNDLESWLRSQNLEPRSRNNLRSVLVQLYRAARARGQLPDQTTAAEKIKKLRIKKSESITHWTPDQMIQILNAAAPDELPWFLLGGFAGVRTEELMPEYDDKDPLRWEDFDWEEKLIHLRQNTSKVNEARDVPILPNLADWLQPYRALTGSIMPHSFKYRPSVIWARVSVAAGIKAKSANRLRHSFGIYRLGAIKDIEQVAHEMGTSIYKAKSNYVRPKNPSAIKAWWSIYPKRSHKIMPFPKSQNSHTISRSKRAIPSPK
jgi:integrase